MNPVEYQVIEHLFDANEHSHGWYAGNRLICQHNELTQALQQWSVDGWTICGSLNIDDVPTLILCRNWEDRLRLSELARKKGSD